MKNPSFKPEADRLRWLLRESHPAPSLHPRFQENVWRRIERTEAKPNALWLDLLAGWLLRPRRAFAVASVLVLLGVGLGWSTGAQLVRNEAQTRYLSAVAPNALR